MTPRTVRIIIGILMLIFLSLFGFIFSVFRAIGTLEAVVSSLMDVIYDWAYKK